MTENTMMTAQELDEFRAWLNRRAPSPDDDDFLPVRVTSLHALLATVDALTQRAEWAEGERDEAIQHRDRFRQDNEALGALADARGRALAELVALKDLKDAHFPGTTPDYEIRKPKAWEAAREALSLTAPEALRQQQEREAGKDALIEALRGALEEIAHKADSGIYGSFCDWDEAALYDDLQAALALTPPAALSQQREYVGALEKVAAKASEALAAPSYYWEEAWNEVNDALAALDAVKGGQA
jgi:hypothetical protein